MLGGRLYVRIRIENESFMIFCRMVVRNVISMKISGDVKRNISYLTEYFRLKYVLLILPNLTVLEHNST